MSETEQPIIPPNEHWQNLHESVAKLRDLEKKKQELQEQLWWVTEIIAVWPELHGKPYFGRVYGMYNATKIYDATNTKYRKLAVAAPRLFINRKRLVAVWIEKVNTETKEVSETREFDPRLFTEDWLEQLVHKDLTR